MKSSYLKSIGGAVLGVSLLLGIGMVSAGSAQAQWPWGQNRDYRQDRRDRNRDDRYRDDRYRRGGYDNSRLQSARNRGFQDGLQTGSSDANRRQSYNPYRSHFYKNANDRNAYDQAYRDGFLRGYDDGFRRYGGNRRGNNRNGSWFPW